jgi:hypothetical protein
MRGAGSTCDMRFARFARSVLTRSNSPNARFASPYNFTFGTRSLHSHSNAALRSVGGM